MEAYQPRGIIWQEHQSRRSCDDRRTVYVARDAVYANFGHGLILAAAADLILLAAECNRPCVVRRPSPRLQSQCGVAAGVTADGHDEPRDIRRSRYRDHVSTLSWLPEPLHQVAL